MSIDLISDEVEASRQVKDDLLRASIVLKDPWEVREAMKSSIKAVLAGTALLICREIPAPAAHAGSPMLTLVVR